MDWKFVFTHKGYQTRIHPRSQILKELHKSCQRDDGTDDQKKGTQLLEVYAIEIQMYTETKNNKKLKVCMSVHCAPVYFGYGILVKVNLNVRIAFVVCYNFLSIQLLSYYCWYSLQCNGDFEMERE